MPERAVLYARLSYDRTGEEIGVTTQLRHMRELAEARDYDVVEEVTENDLSATKNLHRPGYEKVW
ncbi:MAG: recombinase family protein, partial [Mycobacterium sp.]